MRHTSARSRKAERKQDLLAELEHFRKEHRHGFVIYVNQSADEHSGAAVSCARCGMNFTLNRRYPAVVRACRNLSLGEWLSVRWPAPITVDVYPRTAEQTEFT